jgi:hypothetical protein
MTTVNPLMERIGQPLLAQALPLILQPVGTSAQLYLLNDANNCACVPLFSVYS